MTEEHPSLGLDETVHQRVRLGILAVLSEAAECTFTRLRDQLELTDGNLNRHLRILEDAGLVEVRKGYDGRRPCTWLRADPLRPTRPARRGSRVGAARGPHPRHCSARAGLTRRALSQDEKVERVDHRSALGLGGAVQSGQPGRVLVVGDQLQWRVCFPA